MPFEAHEGALRAFHTPRRILERNLKGRSQVAEKPSISKAVSEILSGGEINTVSARLLARIITMRGAEAGIPRLTFIETDSGKMDQELRFLVPPAGSWPWSPSIYNDSRQWPPD